MAEMTLDRAAVASDPAVPKPVAAEQRSGPTRRVAISARFLLGIYAIVPLCLLAMVLDRLFWNGELVRHLPTSPESFFLFQILFGTPHIIASTVILATNTNYLRAYWVRLLAFSVLLLLFFGIGQFFLDYNVFLAIVGAATILHVIKQQVGIGKGLCRLTGPVYDGWGWTLILFGSILYFAIYNNANDFARWKPWLEGTLWTLGVTAVVLTLACHGRIPTTLGRLYLWANAILVLLCGLFYAEGYYFLAILAPRLVHDLTAFTFYVAHDVNRHGDEPQNWLYRSASKLGLGVYWVCPAVAVLLTILVDQCTDPLAGLVAPALGYDLRYLVSFVLVGYLGLLHYYTEAFTWRKGSPYRQHIAMAA